MNPLSSRVLLWLVILGVLAAVLDQIAGDALTPAMVQAVELATFFGLLAALLLFIRRPAGPGDDGPPRPAWEPIKTTTFRINALSVVGAVGLVVLLGGLAGVDPELLKLFATGAFMLAKDIVQGDQTH